MVKSCFKIFITFLILFPIFFFGDFVLNQPVSAIADLSPSESLPPCDQGYDLWEDPPEEISKEKLCIRPKPPAGCSLGEVEVKIAYRGKFCAKQARVSGKNPCPGGVCKTALGDIQTNPTAFAERILSIGIGLAGGIALILMVIGSIRILTSSGDQQKLASGRDMIVAAVAGLLFLIFSVLILRFVGIEILGL